MTTILSKDFEETFDLLKVSKTTSHFFTCSNSVSNHPKCSRPRSWKKKVFVHSIKKTKSIIEWIETNCTSRRIKSYKSMSKERSLSSLNESESVKESKKNFDDARIKKQVDF